MSDLIEVADSEGVRTLTLNRPEKLNALNTALTEALREELMAADNSSWVGAVVLMGKGRAFCAGADLSEFAELTPQNQDLVVARAALTAEIQSLPRSMSIPVVAAVSGAAVGGGAGLALGCDLLVVADDAHLSYPEIKHSIVPALVMTGLQRHLGLKLGFEMVATGRRLGAQELLDLRLANRLVTREELLVTAQTLAASLAASSPVAMAAIKGLFYRVADLPYDAAMRAGQDANTIMRAYRG